MLPMNVIFSFFLPFFLSIYLLFLSICSCLTSMVTSNIGLIRLKTVVMISLVKALMHLCLSGIAPEIRNNNNAV